MKFIDNAHEQAYAVLVQRMQADKDIYRQTLAYLLPADEVCRQHIERIYNFDEACINSDCLADSWQTGTSIKTCRLAFNQIG